MSYVICAGAPEDIVYVSTRDFEGSITLMGKDHPEFGGTVKRYGYEALAKGAAARLAREYPSLVFWVEVAP